MGTKIKPGRLLALFCIALILNGQTLHASPLKGDEEIIYFPTNGNLTGNENTWQLPIHGWIFEAEKDSLWRNGVLALLKQHLGLKPESNGSQHLKERGWPFLVDNEENKDIVVRLAGKELKLSPSGDNGHLYGHVRLGLDISAAGDSPQWIEYETVMPPGDVRHRVGEIQLVPARGLSVISDIDDTIKHSHVLDKEALLENTFLKDFEAIPGMAEHYRLWMKQGAAFHYVTGSPWQLYSPLKTFIEAKGFPRGSFSMRYFRLKDSSFIDFLSSSEEYKLNTIEDLMQRFPLRRFILVGDSGEKDPEVYGEIARRHPEQVDAIFIRNVTDDSENNVRITTAFKAVPTKRWHLFTDPGLLGALSKTDGFQ